MTDSNTIIAQVLKLVLKNELKTRINQRHFGHSFRIVSRWSQFVSLILTQLTSRNSLPDILDDLAVQYHRLYHLCAKTIFKQQPGINEGLY
jgi:hypothetical protein